MSTEPAPDEGQAAPPPEASTEPLASPFGELDPDLQGYVANKAWKAPRDVIDAYKRLEGFRGVPEDRLLKLPTDPADMGQVWDRLGRPEGADKYTLALPEELKDGVYDRMASAAHNAGLTDDQFKGMQTEFAEAAKAIEAERTERVAADLENWKAANPTDFNNVRNLMGASGITPDEMAAALSGDSSAFYGALAKVASRMGEKPAAGAEGEGGGTNFRMTPAQAKAKVEAMNADPEFQKRLNSDDEKVRLRAAEERRRFYELMGAGGGDDSNLAALQAENQRLKAQMRGLAGGTL